jgi:hypothetical protein
VSKASLIAEIICRYAQIDHPFSVIEASFSRLHTSSARFTSDGTVASAAHLIQTI